MKRKLWPRVPLVEVIWKDAAIDIEPEGQLNDQDSIDKFGSLAVCRDVGYLISKTKEKVTLAVGLCEDDDSFRHSNAIPARWILAIHHLHRPHGRPNLARRTHHPAPRRNRAKRPGHRHRRRKVFGRQRLH